jgi:hypothetical protein
MDARAEEGLIGVDIADAGHDALVENHRLNGSPAVGNGARQVCGRELARQWFRAEFAFERGVV